MKTIWKFPLGNGDSQRIEMPKNAAILTVQTQDGHACIWAIVDIDDGSETEMRTFEIYGTGQPLREDKDIARPYVATIQQPPFVWHIFEVVQERQTEVALDHARDN